MSILIAMALAQAATSTTPSMRQHRPFDPAARAAHRFEMMDTNHDGQISRSEWIAARERMSEHRMERRGMDGFGGGRRQGGWQGGQAQQPRQ